MATIIRQYEGKLGQVTVTRYEEGGNTEYRVAHTLEAISPSWFLDKRDAVVHAQFLAGKY